MESALKKSILKKILLELQYNSEKVAHEGCGLFSGSMGSALLYYYYWAYTGENKYRDLACGITASIFDNLNAGITTPLYNYAEGIVGIYSTLFHLKRKELIGNNYFVFSEEHNDFFHDLCCDFIDNGNNDFLYGSAGVLFLLYLSYRDNNKKYSKNVILDVIDYLFNSSIFDNLVFQSSYPLKEQQIEISLPHGISSWILLLCKIKRYIVYDKIDVILKNLFQYYMPFISNSMRYDSDSFFPEVINHCGYSSDKIHSRLGWCYGDLPCMMSALSFSSAFKRKDLCDTILAMFCQVSCRYDNERYSVFDAGLCHGYSSVALIYSTLLMMYDCASFRIAKDYWEKQIINSWRVDHDFLKTYKSNNVFIKEKKYGMLEGITGIALYLLSSIYNVYDWAELMLL